MSGTTFLEFIIGAEDDGHATKYSMPSNVSKEALVNHVTNTEPIPSHVPSMSTMLGDETSNKVIKYVLKDGDNSVEFRFNTIMEFPFGLGQTASLFSKTIEARTKTSDGMFDTQSKDRVFIFSPKFVDSLMNAVTKNNFTGLLEYLPNRYEQYYNREFREVMEVKKKKTIPTLDPEEHLDEAFIEQNIRHNVFQMSNAIGGEADVLKHCSVRLFFHLIHNQKGWSNIVHNIMLSMGASTDTQKTFSFGESGNVHGFINMNRDLTSLHTDFSNLYHPDLNCKVRHLYKSYLAKTMTEPSADGTTIAVAPRGRRGRSKKSAPSKRQQDYVTARDQYLTDSDPGGAMDHLVNNISKMSVSEIIENVEVIDTDKYANDDHKEMWEQYISVTQAEMEQNIDIINRHLEEEGVDRNQLIDPNSYYRYILDPYSPQRVLRTLKLCDDHIPEAPSAKPTGQSSAVDNAISHVYTSVMNGKSDTPIGGNDGIHLKNQVIGTHVQQAADKREMEKMNDVYILSTLPNSGNAYYTTISILLKMGKSPLVDEVDKLVCKCDGSNRYPMYNSEWSRDVLNLLISAIRRL